MHTILIVSAIALLQCATAQPAYGKGMRHMWSSEDEEMGEWQQAKEHVRKWIDYDIESAPYQLIDSTEKYEIRSYPARKWACSTNDIEGVHPTEDERSQNFMRLFSYISGSNKAGMKIKMTTPVTMTTMRGRSGRMFRMCFYIPSMHQNDAPESWDPSITVQDRPELKAIAARFGGYATNEDYESMAKQLKMDAKKDGQTNFDFSQYFSAGYDAPMKFWNRRNEVWFLGANKENMAEEY